MVVQREGEGREYCSLREQHRQRCVVNREQVMFKEAVGLECGWVVEEEGSVHRENSTCNILDVTEAMYTHVALSNLHDKPIDYVALSSVSRTENRNSCSVGKFPQVPALAYCKVSILFIILYR